MTPPTSMYLKKAYLDCKSGVEQLRRPPGPKKQTHFNKSPFFHITIAPIILPIYNPRNPPTPTFHPTIYSSANPPPKPLNNSHQIPLVPMATPNQEAIDTFISITGASEAVALRKLEVISLSSPELWVVVICEGFDWMCRIGGACWEFLLN